MLMMKIILASQSPRRKELLAGMGVRFEAIPSRYNEKLDDLRSPEEVSVELALGKAKDVARDYPNCLVIGSDTIVTVNGRQLEKPKDAQEALDMLKMLSGTYNEVSTGVAVVRLSDNMELTGVDTTRVLFKPYDEEAIKAYVATGDPFDKAGAYGIQSGAAILVDRIEGHYDTVIGFPTHIVAKLLDQVSVSASPVRLKSPVAQVL